MSARSGASSGAGWRGAARLAVLALLAAGGCKLDTVTTSLGERRIVVHAVLNPQTPDETFLIEELLTGRVEIPDTLHFDPSEPVLSGGGVPIEDAEVRIEDLTANTSGRAYEDRTFFPGGKGAGVYRLVNGPPPMFPQPGDSADRHLPILRGHRYRLTIRTTDGRVATAETTIPTAIATVTYTSPAPFDRDTDTLRLSWTPAEQTARYLFRITTPLGPFIFFTDSTGVAVPGTLQNIFAEGIPHVFIPGFVQNVSIAAVDTNYYDYYRSASDPFTGTGRLSHVAGGSGVFGSYVQMVYRPLDVTATADEPIEGRWINASDIAWPPSLRLWVDERIQGVTVLTGNYPDPTGAGHDGIVGHMESGRISLAFLRAQVANDTAATIGGVVHGDSLILGPPATPVVYRKAP